MPAFRFTLPALRAAYAAALDAHIRFRKLLLDEVRDSREFDEAEVDFAAAQLVANGAFAQCAVDALTVLAVDADVDMPEAEVLVRWIDETRADPGRLPASTHIPRACVPAAEECARAFETRLREELGPVDEEIARTIRAQAAADALDDSAMSDDCDCDDCGDDCGDNCGDDCGGDDGYFACGAGIVTAVTRPLSP